MKFVCLTKSSSDSYNNALFASALLGIMSAENLTILIVLPINPDFPIDIGKGFNVSFSNGIPLENAMAGY